MRWGRWIPGQAFELEEVSLSLRVRRAKASARLRTPAQRRQNPETFSFWQLTGARKAVAKALDRGLAHEGPPGCCSGRDRHSKTTIARCCTTGTAAARRWSKSIAPRCRTLWRVRIVGTRARRLHRPRTAGSDCSKRQWRAFFWMIAERVTTLQAKCEGMDDQASPPGGKKDPVHVARQRHASDSTLVGRTVSETYHRLICIHSNSTVREAGPTRKTPNCSVPNLRAPPHSQKAASTSGRQRCWLYCREKFASGPRLNAPSFRRRGRVAFKHIQGPQRSAEFRGLVKPEFVFREGLCLDGHHYLIQQAMKQSGHNVSATNESWADTGLSAISRQSEATAQVGRSTPGC